MLYGMTKAIWRGEPEYRREVTGSTARSFTSREETQAVLLLLLHYRDLRKQGKVAQDDSVEPLLPILDAEQVSDLVIYDVVSRVSPNALLTLGDEERARVRRYVERYVLPLR